MICPTAMPSTIARRHRRLRSVRCSRAAGRGGGV